MVYILLAEGFEEVEAVMPIDVLRRCGVDLITVGVSDAFEIGSDYIRGSHNISVKADINIGELRLDDETEMLILPGGPGRVNIEKSASAMEIIERAFELDIYVAAICGAPEVLGRAGFLKGKKATCFPGLEKELIGAEVIENEAVVVDGKLITSKGAGTAVDFAFKLAEILCGKEKADEIYKVMQFQ